MTILHTIKVDVEALALLDLYINAGGTNRESLFRTALRSYTTNDPDVPEVNMESLKLLDLYVNANRSNRVDILQAALRSYTLQEPMEVPIGMIQ